MSRRDYVRSELQNYNYCKKRIEELKIRIRMVEYKMANVHSPRLDGVAVHQSSNGKSDGWYNLQKKKENYESEIQSCKQTISHVNRILKSVSERDRAILSDLYVEGYTMKQMARKYSFRLNYMYKLVDRILDSVAKREE